MRHFHLLLLPALIAALANTPAAAKNTLHDWMDRSVRNIMAVHFYGATQVDEWKRAYGTPPLPDDPDKKVTVQPIVPHRQLGRSLECHQFRTRSVRDWQRERIFDENGYPTSLHYAGWMLPAYRNITVTSHFGYFADWPVFVSMAVFGNEFEMEQILNHHRDRISVEVLKKTHELHEYRYDLYTKNLLYRRPIKLIRRKQCDGFRIFDFEVHEHG